MDGSLEQATMRRVAWRLIPFICLLYFVAFIDRVNIGFAALTMNKDLGFSSTVFGFGAGVFFFGYFLFEIPSNIILDKVGARLWIARVMISWGFLSGAFAFITGETSFYVLRFLLGAAEAGFFPGIILYLSFWFPARYRAAVVSLFMAAAPLSVLFGSPVSSLLLEMDGLLGLHGWQWMFLAEALPAVILGIVVLFYLTDRPEKATWLADEQRAWLVAEMEAERAGKRANARHNLLSGLADPRVLALALIYFGTSAGLYTLGIWAPQIIKGLGLSTMHVGLLNAVPPTVAVVAMVLWARHSDRTGERTWHVVIACLAASLGLVLAGAASTRGRRHRRAEPRQRRDQRRQAAALGHADHVPLRLRGRRGHRHHQRDRQPRRLRRPLGDRLDQGPDRQLRGRPDVRSRAARRLGHPDSRRRPRRAARRTRGRRGALKFPRSLRSFPVARFRRKTDDPFGTNRSGDSS